MITPYVEVLNLKDILVIVSDGVIFPVASRKTIWGLPGSSLVADLFIIQVSKLVGFEVLDKETDYAQIG